MGVFIHDCTSFNNEEIGSEAESAKGLGDYMGKGMKDQNSKINSGG